MKNPKWQREEIILALELYHSSDRGAISKTNPKIIALSETLRKLRLQISRPDEKKFRNANGVSLKLSNFLAIDPSYGGAGMKRGSKLDRAIFQEYGNDTKRLAFEANRIRKEYL
jgi:5-methylcytosine-specific restriction protein A